MTTPTAALVGNYHGYYSMRSIPPEDRLRGMQREWIYNRKCLDIGCNSGHITFHLAEAFLPKSILGIDVDPALIHRARDRLVHTASLAQPPRPHSKVGDAPSSSSSATATAASSSSLKLRNPTFMPRSVRLTLEIKPIFPHNISFIVQDIMAVDRTSPGASDSIHSSTYGTIFCLSLTKWIHLNHGDDGLLRFFRLLNQLLDIDGFLILEFQAWQSYINNKNTSSLTKETFKSILIKPEDFESQLMQLGFEVVQRLGAPVESARGFNRPILVLKKKRNCDVVGPSRDKAGDDSLMAVDSNKKPDPSRMSKRESVVEADGYNSNNSDEIVEEAESKKRKRKEKKSKHRKKERREAEDLL